MRIRDTVPVPIRGNIYALQLSVYDLCTKNRFRITYIGKNMHATGSTWSVFIVNSFQHLFKCQATAVERFDELKYKSCSL